MYRMSSFRVMPSSGQRRRYAAIRVSYHISREGAHPKFSHALPIQFHSHSSIVALHLQKSKTILCPFQKHKMSPQLSPPLFPRSYLAKMSSKFCGFKSTLIVVHHAVTAMLVFVDTLQVNAEEGIGQQAGASWVREVAIDDEHCKGHEQRIPSYRMHGQNQSSPSLLLCT